MMVGNKAYMTKPKFKIWLEKGGDTLLGGSVIIGHFMLDNIDLIEAFSLKNIDRINNFKFKNGVNEAYAVIIKILIFL